MTSHIGVRILLVSAIASGQGKTTVTAALARKLKHQGKRVRAFKTSPDFLDPMLLERASDAPVQSSMRRVHADGVPIWAECGGMTAGAALFSKRVAA